MAHTPGPNDFHYDGGVMKPGLGDDEPSDALHESVAREAEANRLRQEALDRAASTLAQEADVVERRQQELDAREAALEARERELRLALGTSSDSSVDPAEQEARRTTTKQATERASS